ncbi:MAG TPA: MFS transporter [Streptosporangiaceae bacterium]|nr:MFS transporter [Streptosporangiaceae bacterium]
MGLSGARPQARRAADGLASGLRSTGRAGASTARGTGRVIRRLTQASGAGRTGLDRVLELTAAGAAADAFVAVALAGTLFFSTSVDQARGRIALTLLITMAPFAVLAPFIGPMLDRVRDGRRYIMVGTLLARGLLCWGMAGAVQHSDTVTLLPAAFGVLVLQKAYGVTRSAVTPRVLPASITLVSANARISLASLIASTLGVGVAGGISFLAGGGTAGATWALRVGTLVYLAAIALGIRLPTQVDQRDPQDAPSAAGPAGAAPGAAGPNPSPGGPPRSAAGTGPAGAGPNGTGPDGATAPGAAGGGRPAAVPPRAAAPPRRARWASTLRSLGPVVGEAMRGNAALRAFSGYMIFFLAFLLRTVHFPGVSDKLALAEMIAAAAAGGFIGTAIGAAMKARAPHLILFVLLGTSTVITAACAVFFGLWAALIVALVAAFGQVLAKLALDSIVQREVREEIRSSTLAASETIHQLAWVAGGLAGLAMSITDSGVAGLAVAAGGLATTFVALVAARRRRVLARRRMSPDPVR